MITEKEWEKIVRETRYFHRAGLGTPKDGL